MQRRVRIANRRGGGWWWKLPVVLVVWAIVAAPILAAITAYVVVRDYARDLPTAPDLAAWSQRAPTTSRILAWDGTLLAELPFRVRGEVGYRDPVDFEDIPPLLVGAILAAEDARFFSHRGVDPRAVVRAAVANYRAQKVIEGASTITQQLARNLLPDAIGTERSLRRKVREALLAYRLERRHSKREIFAAYANYVFLGDQSYGVAAAARRFWGLRLSELSLAQAALVAGQIQAPSRTDPTRYPSAARARRDEVLGRMAHLSMISADELAEARASDVALSPPPSPRGSASPWIAEEVRRRYFEGEGAMRGGLVIETTAQPVLDRDLREMARSWIERLVGKGDAPPEVALLIWDHNTGYVDGVVGGLDWSESQFDRTGQACRQPGSAFKPLVYGAALERGEITPGTALRDGPVSVWDDRLGVHWKPENSGRNFRGVALAQDALASSLNAPAIDVIDRVGPRAVIEFARRLGIASELAEVRPLALGASCVTPAELLGVYAVIARGGRAFAPTPVRRVTRRGIVAVDSASPYDPAISAVRRLDRMAQKVVQDAAEPLLDPAIAYQLRSMLRDVVVRGTATAARAMGRSAAGKTGTTNGNTDAWFVGFTARVAAAVWIGHDDPETTLGPRQDGGRAALPLWIRAVQRAEDSRQPRDVVGEPPQDMIPARIDRETGLLAQPRAGGAVELYFIPGTEPTEMVGASVQPGGLDFESATRGF